MPFRPFYDRYVSCVWRFVRSWIRNKADVEEVVQEVFLVAAQRRHTLDDPARMHSWLYGIARNLILNRRRLSWFRRVIRWAERGGEGDDGDDATAAASPDDENRDRLRRIFERVEALPPKFRRPWEMAHFDDLTLDEIAKHEGCSLAQLKRRLHEAKRRVKADVDDGDGDEREGDDNDEDGHEE